jgi:hypothetical protein
LFLHLPNANAHSSYYLLEVIQKSLDLETWVQIAGAGSPSCLSLQLLMLLEQSHEPDDVQLHENIIDVLLGPE